MKARFLALALTLCTTSAMAQATIDLDVLAAESGLTQRQLGMLFGAHGAYSEFRSSYVQVRNKFTRAVGKDRYEALLAVYKARQEGRQVAATVARKAKAGS